MADGQSLSQSINISYDVVDPYLATYITMWLGGQALYERISFNSNNIKGKSFLYFIDIVPYFLINCNLKGMNSTIHFLLG